MRKIVLIMLAAVFVMGCSNNDGEENTNGSDTNNQEPNTEESAVNEANNDKSEQDKRDENNGNENVVDEDETEVILNGELTYKNHILTVEGETNLPKDASIFINPNTLDGSMFVNVSESTKVEIDGTFHHEINIPDNYDYGLDVKLRFRPEEQQEDSIQAIYGVSGENLEGPFVRLYESMDEIKQEASISVYMPLEDNNSAHGTISTPDWQKPEDYGDEEIWIELDIEENEDFLHIEGKSNLIEGSELSIGLLNADGGRSKASGIKVHVNPDGSFRGQLDITKIEDDLDGYELKIIFKPTEFSWENVSEHYGTGGEHMSGDLVEDWVDDQQVILQTPVK